MSLLSRSTTRRGAAFATALALAGAAFVAGPAATAAPAGSSTVHTVDYLADTYGLSAGHVFENVTFERFEFLLKSEGRFAFLVGSPQDGLTSRVIGHVDAAARELGVQKVYVFDPLLDGADVDIRTSPLTAVSALYTRLVTSYLNQDTDPQFGDEADGRDPYLFVYDSQRTVDAAADRIVSSLVTAPSAQDLAAPGAATTFRAEIAGVLSAAGPLSTSTQLDFYRTEVNRKHTASYADSTKYGGEILTDADADFRLQSVSYPELKHILSSEGDFVIFFGGTWCHNTRAVIKDVNAQAVAKGVERVYVFDNRIEGNLAGDLHIRDTSSKLAHLYGDLVSTYLPNLVTEYTVERNGVKYYPGGDTSLPLASVKKLQVPYVLQYDKSRTVDGAPAPIVRQWIRDNGNGTYKEYMTEWWYRLGLPGYEEDPAKLATAYAFADEAVAKLATFFADVTAVTPVVEPTTPATPAPAPTAAPTPAPTVPAPAAPRATSTSLKLAKKSVAYGTRAKVTVTVAGAAAGKVTVRDGAKVLGTVAVPASGKASYTLPASLKVGSHKITARYAPADATVAAPSASGAVTLKVTKAKAKVGVKTTAKVTKAKRGTVKVTVTAKGSTVKASGKYTVKVGRTTVKTGKLAKGAASVRLPRLAAGTHKVTVRYAGSTSVAAGTTTLTVTVR